MPAWESACRLRACGSQWPTVEQHQPRRGRSVSMVARKTLVQNNSLSPPSIHISHTTNITLSRIKWERLYFYKEVCSFFHWSSSLCLIMFCLYLYVCGYTTVGISLITLGNNYLLFECCLDFYNWFRVFFTAELGNGIRFSPSCQGFFCVVDLKKNQIFWQNRLHFYGIIPWLLLTHIILNMFFKRKNVLPTTYIDYLIEKLITVNWMVGIDKATYT